MGQNEMGFRKMGGVNPPFDAASYIHAQALSQRLLGPRFCVALQLMLT
jgi:hypothetical protein